MGPGRVRSVLVESLEQESQWGLAADIYVLLNDVHFPEWLVCIHILRHQVEWWLW